MPPRDIAGGGQPPLRIEKQRLFGRQQSRARYREGAIRGAASRRPELHREGSRGDGGLQGHGDGCGQFRFGCEREEEG